MGLIRRYGQFPAMFVPDQGETVLASHSPAGPFTRAVVLSVHRAADDFIRVSVQWIDEPDRPNTSIYVRRDDQVPLLRRVPVVRKAG
jgi:hypothetical protein